MVEDETPPYLGRLGESLVYRHHLFVVEQTRHFTSVENAVDVFQKRLVNKLRIIQQEHRGPDANISSSDKGDVPLNNHLSSLTEHIRVV